MATRQTQLLARTLMTPAVALLFIWMIVPLALTIYFSTLHYNLLDPDSEQLRRPREFDYFLTDPGLPRLAAEYAGAGRLGAGAHHPDRRIPLALLLDQPVIGRSIVRLMVIAPFFVMPTVSALVWKNLLMHPVSGLFAWIATLVRRCTPIDWFTDAPLLADHPDRLLAMAAVRDPDPADGAAVARRGAEGSGRDGRRRRAVDLHLHHAAASGAADHGRDPDRDDLPADACSPRSSSPPAAARACRPPTSPS